MTSGGGNQSLVRARTKWGWLVDVENKFLESLSLDETNLHLSNTLMTNASHEGHPIATALCIQKKLPDLRLEESDDGDSDDDVNSAETLARKVKGTSTPVEKAFAILSKFGRVDVELRHDWATLFYAITLYDGEGCERDYEEAHRTFLFLSENCEDQECKARAFYRLGYCWYAGIGNLIQLKATHIFDKVYPNYDDYKALAVKCWKTAAEMGYHVAQHWLGACYFCGEAVQNDIVIAEQWWRRASMQGYKPSTLKLEEHFIVNEKSLLNNINT